MVQMRMDAQRLNAASLAQLIAEWIMARVEVSVDPIGVRASSDVDGPAARRRRERCAVVDLESGDWSDDVLDT